jgi:molybdopterin-containing oxidoreductase family iron-sulfur binding subunit
VQIGLPTGARSTGFEATRRDVLSLLGFSLGAAGVAAGCRAPTQKALPLPVASDQMVAGVANFYATTCGGCSAACSLVVRQRDGRPIKLEGNEASTLFGGGTCATGQATVLSLYDEARARGPVIEGHPANWAAVDERIARALEASRGDVVLLSRTLTSPSTRALVEVIGDRHPRFRHVTYDAVSASAIRAANARSFGVAVVPHYRFGEARVIVALDADFLGTWLSPVEFAHQYARGRTQDGGRSFHVQVESEMSVTGTNADLRIAVAPSELGPFAVALLGAVARQGGDGALASDAAAFLAAAPAQRARTWKIERIARRLLAHRGTSLVVSGSEDPAVQTIVNALNATLGNVGKTVDLARPSLQRQGDDEAFAALVDDLKSGKIAALLLWDANPVYDHPLGPAFAEALARVPLTVSFADRVDETSAHAQLVAPDHHFLESWGDAEPVAGFFSLRQPLIAPLHDTRAAVESLIKWFQLADVPPDAHDYLRGFWRRTLFPRRVPPPAQTAATFEEFWDQTLERGVVELPPDGPAPDLIAFPGEWKGAARAIAVAAERQPGGAPGAPGQYELHLHQTVGVREGTQSNNPWLLELPDPVTRLTWGNVARIAPATAAALGLESGDVVALATGAGKLEAPVFVQAGQHRGTISLAVGYGRWAAGKAGNGVGVNAYPLAPVTGAVRGFSAAVGISKLGRRARLAPAQTHFSMEGRPIVQQMSLESEPGEAREALPNLWAERLHGQHSWGMSIDLDACTGCSACVVACQAENNVPVVGPTQIYKTRIMHWLRIDRYVEGDDEEATMVHQPMLCQHCQHAPCETVCPVLATSTSSDGINQQVYNRCIGTRYCANNCPYKVRRFNWHDYTTNDDFDYNMTSPLGRLVLNPDVTVRSRGVMEKCSLCVQRIQLAKNQALQERRPVADGDVRTACQQSCPTGAIVFGDLQDPGSRVSKLLAGRRAYRVLEELGTRPNVGYLKKVKPPELT